MKKRSPVCQKIRKKLAQKREKLAEKKLCIRNALIMLPGLLIWATVDGWRKDKHSM